MFFFELSTFSNKHTNKQKRTSGCSWHIIVIHRMHLGSNRMFLMSWLFLGGIPTIDSSTKHGFNYFPKSNTICETKTQWHQVLFRFCSVVHMAPDPSKNIVPLSTMFIHHAFGAFPYRKHQLLIDDIYWYFHHSLKTLILHIFKVVPHVRRFSLFIHSPTACPQAVHHFSIFHPSISIPTFCCQAAVFFKY